MSACQSYQADGDAPGQSRRNRVCQKTHVVDGFAHIYIVSSKRMLKAAWNGKKFSIDEKDGGWTAGHNNMNPKVAIEKGSISRSSETTPAYMGLGDDEDKLVIIADAGKKGTSLVAYWQDKIPADFKQKPGTVSRRIADQISIKISFLAIEPSPNVLGYRP